VGWLVEFELVDDVGFVFEGVDVFGIFDDQ
jgi:hypothetical protein